MLTFDVDWMLGGVVKVENQKKGTSHYADALASLQGSGPKKQTYMAFRKKLMNLRKRLLKCNLPAETEVPRVINPRGPSQFRMPLFSPEAKGEA